MQRKTLCYLMYKTHPYEFNLPNITKIVNLLIPFCPTADVNIVKGYWFSQW